MPATRFEVNGERHYRTDKEDKAYPSVTTILGKVASDKSKKALLNWQLKILTVPQPQPNEVQRYTKPARIIFEGKR